MDPSIFFGRSRVTRQTSKPKQPSVDKENLKSEVKKNSALNTQRNGKGTLAEVKNEAVPIRRNAARAASKKSEKITKSKPVDVSSERKIQGSRKGKKVCFADKTVSGDEDQTETSNSVIPGPVYKNVRRSDVRDDPVDEYAFDEIDSFSESSAPPKKKKKRQPQKKKPAAAVVKWDPSKKPVVKTRKPITKNLKSKSEEKVQKTCDKITGKPILSSKVVSISTTQTIPTPNGPDRTTTSLGKQQFPQLHQKETVVGDSFANASLDFQVDSHFTSTPSSGNISSRLNMKHSRLTNTSAEVVAIKTTSTALNSNKKLSEISAGVCLPSETQTISPVAKSLMPSCASSNKSCDQPKSNTHDKLLRTKHTNVSLQVEASSKNMQGSTSFLCTPVRQSPCISISSICVRESPSFMETEPVLEVQTADSSESPASLETELLTTVSSTPITRSKAQLACTISSPRKESVPSSPAVIEESSFKSDDISKLFDDFPRTSVIPTRMFSTHRGTIFVPEADSNINKRKLPDVSPTKKQVGSRATTVKFSVPEASANVDNCFGFDDDNDSPFIPKPNPIPRLKKVNEEQKVKKPNLSIQDVQALIRGQLQLSSPANSTPRSVQTKLTDFVSSTPTASTRSKLKTNQVVLTPTPVPLFGEENLDKDIPSPFCQLSRRSYDRFRPVKRIACGDEVLSGDEIDETEVNQNETKSTTGVEIKKKNRSYKKKKKPEETQFDNWAEQMASHFNEVENIDLEVN